VFTGAKYAAGRPLSEIAAMVRDDLAEAVTAGAFPVGVTFEVRAGQPGRMVVTVRGLPAEFAGSELVAAKVSIYANAYNRIVRPLFGDDGDQEYEVEVFYADIPASAVAAEQIAGHIQRWQARFTPHELTLMRGAQQAMGRVAGTLFDPPTGDAR
jgi:hypothetical protein